MEEKESQIPNLNTAESLQVLTAEKETHQAIPSALRSEIEEEKRLFALLIIKTR